MRTRVNWIRNIELPFIDVIQISCQYRCIRSNLYSFILKEIGTLYSFEIFLNKLFEVIFVEDERGRLNNDYLNTFNFILIHLETIRVKI